MKEQNETLDIMYLVAKIVACYVSNNKIESSEVPTLIYQVYQALNVPERNRERRSKAVI